MTIYEHKFLIGLRDVDSNNKLCDKSLLKFMEEVAGMHSDSVGYGASDRTKTNIAWILLNWKVKIFKRPICGTTITAKTWSRYSNKFYSYRDFEVYEDNNELIAIATSKWLIMNLEKNCIAKITNDIVEKYDPCPKYVFDEEFDEKLSEPKTHESEFDYTILRRDIDINNHVHNLYYLDFAYEALPEDLYLNTSFNDIEIMYKKEVKLGEQIRCLYTMQNDIHIITIKSNDLSTVHAIIKLYNK